MHIVFSVAPTVSQSSLVYFKWRFFFFFFAPCTGVKMNSKIIVYCLVFISLITNELSIISEVSL